MAQVLLKPEDVILVESPTYNIAVDLFHRFGFRVVGIPMDGQGMQVEKLEKLLQQHHPKLIYTIPNFHNPTGTCLSGARRRQLIVLADRYNVPILEDDFVGDLRYDGRAQPALKSLDTGRPGHLRQHLFQDVDAGHPGGLPGRGWAGLRQLARLQTPERPGHFHLDPARPGGLCHRGPLPGLPAPLLPALPQTPGCHAGSHRAVPAGGVAYDPPQGGLFLWLRLPDGMRADELLPLACEEGVSFAPGSHFFLDGRGGGEWMRLNFVSQPVEEIEEGMKRLGKAIRRMEIHK